MKKFKKHNLKPCPRCDDRWPVIKKCTYDDKHNSYFVFCRNPECAASTLPHSSEDYAISGWNGSKEHDNSDRRRANERLKRIAKRKENVK